MEIKTRKDLEREGYVIKFSSSVGWWVDGAMGYSVTGYFTDEREAVKEAIEKINRVKRNNLFPIWRFY